LQPRELKGSVEGWVRELKGIPANDKDKTQLKPYKCRQAAFSN